MSTLQEKLDAILLEAGTEKTASAQSKASESTTSITDGDAEGLIKLSSMLRSVSIEPTYKDLYNFVEGLKNGSR